jgi:NAD-dependent DNA ligase
VLIALGIRHVGSGVAGILASHFGDLDALVRPARRWRPCRASGPRLQRRGELLCGLHNRAEVERLRELGVVGPQQSARVAATGLAGKSSC